MLTRVATPQDAAAIARICDEGIEDRIATFQTRLRSAEDVMVRFDGLHPSVTVAEGERVVGFAATSAYRSREFDAGIAEFPVYVARDARGRGWGAWRWRR